MAAAPTKWTDERLDDNADRLTRFEANVDQRFDKVDQRFDRVDQRFDKVDERFDRLETQMRAGFVGLAAESKAASEKIDTQIQAINRTVWAAIIAAGIAKLLFG